MSDSSQGTSAWEADASLLRGISHPVRLCVLDLLRGGPRSVSEVNEVVGVVQPNLSQHLAVLREAGLVTSEADGPRRLYRLRCPAFVESLLVSLGRARDCPGG